MEMQPPPAFMYDVTSYSSTIMIHIRDSNIKGFFFFQGSDAALALLQHKIEHAEISF